MRHDSIAGLLGLLVLGIPGANVHWTPKSREWRQLGGEPGEPDLLIEIPGWSPIYVDVSVQFPVQGHPGSPFKPGEGAHAEELSKQRKYPAWKERVRSTVRSFEPCILEAFGRIGKRSGQLIKRLATRCANDTGVPVAKECERWRGLLALRLVLSQSDILLNA
jgi:hypothetical protein